MERIKEMTDSETVEHLRRWVEEDKKRGHSLFAWATDACGYKQHIRFVEHRNINWTGGTDEQFRQFILDYADNLEKGEQS